MIKIILKLKSPLLSVSERLEDIGAIIINSQLIIISANHKCHEIFRYPNDFLYGKPISTIVHENAEEKDLHDEQILSLIKTEEKVIARRMSATNDGKFVSIVGGDGSCVKTAMFYINDPVSRIAGCFFIEHQTGDDVSDVVNMIIRLEELRNDLIEVVKERNLDYRFKKTYKELISNWKRIGISIGSILLFTSGVVGLFVSGLTGNRFGEKPSEFYQRIEEKLENSIKNKVKNEIEEQNEYRRQQIEVEKSNKD